MMKQRLSREEWIDYLTPLARRVNKRKSNNQPTAKNVAKLTRGKYSAQKIRMALVHNKIDHKEVGMVRKEREKYRRRDEWIDYLTPLARKVKRRKTNNQTTAKNVAAMTRGKYSAQDIQSALARRGIDYKEVEMVKVREEYRSREEWTEYLTPLARKVKRRKTNNQPTPKNVAALTRGKYSDGHIRRVLSYHGIDHKEVGMVKGRAA
jgi:SOS response regulatory protein OraA/RecX